MVQHVLVHIHPNPGKEKRCVELLEWLAGEVKANEPDTSVYQVHETRDEGDGELMFVVYMVLKDEETIDRRQQLPHNQKLKKILKDEELLRELKYLRLTNTGGFRR
ncbi:Hypothetical protein R9X50_00644300 [Acrodontium crateriforme]|uniref:ABM domain-containing protein n=1 Tax=Acrodontium crateriforme TaxID=150365 RepID=A0AAQ3M9T6_9PEZI|nr:Hypothetical protein R9X50_00644300 [Acrodontium crateriforme]